MLWYLSTIELFCLYNYFVKFWLKINLNEFTGTTNQVQYQKLHLGVAQANGQSIGYGTVDPGFNPRQDHFLRINSESIAIRPIQFQNLVGSIHRLI